MKSGTLVPALSCCLVLLGVASALTAESSPRPVSISSETSVRGTKAAEPCVAGPNRLCLNDTRFGIEVLWTDFDHNQGLGTVALPPTDDSGLFWFFSESNWELLVKVLDGCTFNDHFWVFSAATTNTAYTLRVTDHVTDIVREYFNPLGQSAPAITDTTAFPTCSQPGEGPAVFMFADPSDLGVGSSSLITLIARRADGSAAGPGERIQLSAELGQVTGEVFTDSQGEALAIFTAGQQPGRGRVTASFLDGESSSIELTIREPQQDAELLVFANPSVLAIGDISIITVIARDSDGISLGAGQRIRLVADLGDVGPEVFTDEHGEAEAIFRASYQPGQATVTAIMEGKSPAQAQLEILDAPATLFLTASRAAVGRSPEGETIELFALVTNGRGERLADQAVRFAAGRGSLEPAGIVLTDPEGIARATLTVRASDISDIPEGGTFEVTAIVGSYGLQLSHSTVIRVLGPP